MPLINHKKNTASPHNNRVLFRSTKLNKNFVTKSYIFSDVYELNDKNSSLFDCVLVVGFKEKKYYSTDQINLDDYIHKSSPCILWKFPLDKNNINPAIPDFCFPDSENRIEFKKNEFGKKNFYFFLIEII